MHIHEGFNSAPFTSMAPIIHIVSKSGAEIAIGLGSFAPESRYLTMAAAGRWVREQLESDIDFWAFSSEAWMRAFSEEEIERGEIRPPGEYEDRIEVITVVAVNPSTDPAEAATLMATMDIIRDDEGYFILGKPTPLIRCENNLLFRAFQLGYEGRM